ncbi:MAG: hypothetical protein QOG46_2487 [Pseudonocardiales bacterium]|nr:hypothetical protein [Pseudonocardiales bacterium]
MRVRSYLKIFQNIEPTLRCRPDFVHGMPVARDTLRLPFVIPIARFQLKPPLFMCFPLLLLSNVVAVMHGHYGNGTYRLSADRRTEGLSLWRGEACGYLPMVGGGHAPTSRSNPTSSLHAQCSTTRPSATRQM